MNGDVLVAAVRLSTCPSCGAGALSVTKPKYGWGSMGAQYECRRCSLRLRVPWKSLIASGLWRGLLVKGNGNG